MRKLFVATATVAIFALLVTPAMAKKGNNNGSGQQVTAGPSITLNDADPHLGGWVNFSVVLPQLPGWVNPRIQIICWQGGVMTYGEAGAYDASFMLGGAGSDWLRNGGAADCQADLYYWSSSNAGQKFNLLASTPLFTAQG